ncbi:death on curing protein [Tistlia consotensis]|uniref:Death on curing protein n=1 Tax=Tistlia consotensis USBA 355 TaxID=560819 RepID=A0A1Y6B873_9PROT|nr:type II toxin-antitoxin system death-on-curing family toxin [Tistlia consotensis]SME89425.1 death on curing protein [Tistlia consotensis USBA 355]SNR25960.1 death on curing protein [Tistlia consotensis]
MTWRWLSRALVETIHSEQIDEHVGAQGLRDADALEAALARPRNKAAYGTPGVFELAAAYAFGLARNHPFVDGNKRSAAVAMELFLELHGQELTASDAHLVVAIRDLAAGDLTEDQLALWLSDSCVARRAPPLHGATSSP